jgi:hypothetical protein
VISLIIPNDNLNYYTIVDDFLFGPYSPLDTTFDDQVIPYRSTSDSLSQGQSLYHENNVKHAKLEGNLSVNPDSSGMQSTSDVFNPFSIRFNYDTTRPLDCPYGTAFVGACPYTVDDAGKKWHAAVSEVLPRGMTTFRISSATYYGESLSRISLRKTVFYLNTISGNYQPQYYLYEIRTVPANLTPKSVEDVNSLQVFQDLWDKSGRGNTYSGSKSRWWSKPAKARSLSIASISERIDSLARSLRESPDVPLVEAADFGDLAMKASAQVNANKVNMIAFLRDLRHPLEMIPKLKNLSRLKDLASDFLAVDYGLLPTVSDIQEIFRSFSKFRPFIDSNGFSTYNASFLDSASSGIYLTELEQRIKIAIDDEDDDLQKLMEKVDSMGFLLTLENIWDLIPYSFAVDWFINIGGFLERVDTRMRILRLNIQYATMSKKYTTSMMLYPSPELPISGKLSSVSYSRWTSDQCPLPPFTFQNTTDVSDHWLEAGALLLQRTK